MAGSNLVTYNRVSKIINQYLINSKFDQVEKNKIVYNIFTKIANNKELNWKEKEELSIEEFRKKYNR